MTLSKTPENIRSLFNEIAGKYDFMMCSSSFLVNPMYIQEIGPQTVTVGEDKLEISRLKKKSFMLQFNEWLAKGGGIL